MKNEPTVKDALIETQTATIKTIKRIGEIRLRTLARLAATLIVIAGIAIYSFWQYEDWKRSRALFREAARIKVYEECKQIWAEREQIIRDGFKAPNSIEDCVMNTSQAEAEWSLCIDQQWNEAYRVIPRTQPVRECTQENPCTPDPLDEKRFEMVKKVCGEPPKKET